MGFPDGGPTTVARPFSPVPLPVNGLDLRTTWESAPEVVWWDTPETCRFLVVDHLGGRTYGSREVSCGGPEPGRATGLVTWTIPVLPGLSPDPGVVQEVAPRDWTNLWVVTRSRLLSVRMDTGEVSPRTVELPRSDWRGAWRDPRTGTLRVLDSGGVLYRVVGGGVVEVVVKVNLPDHVRVHGDGTWNWVLGAPVVLLEDTVDRGVSLWTLDESTGAVEPLERSVGLPPQVAGVATSDGRWVWVTGVGVVVQVNPRTGEVVESWTTGVGAPVAGTVVTPGDPW